MGYVFYWSNGGNRYGPRFYFEALLPLTLFMGAGMERLTRTRVAKPIIAGVAIATVATLAVLGSLAYRQILARRDVYRVVEKAGLERAIVLLTTASADMVRSDLNRNPPDFRDAPVLYGMSRPGLDHEVLEKNPGRTLYYYEWREQGGHLWRAPPLP
jgi:hypothetical protein